MGRAQNQWDPGTLFGCHHRTKVGWVHSNNCGLLMFSVLIINYKYLLCLLYLYVFIVLMTMVYCTYDYCIVNGINKRTHNWGRHIAG